MNEPSEEVGSPNCLKNLQKRLSFSNKESRSKVFRIARDARDREETGRIRYGND